MLVEWKMFAGVDELGGVLGSWEIDCRAQGRLLSGAVWGGELGTQKSYSLYHNPVGKDTPILATDSDRIIVLESVLERGVITRSRSYSSLSQHPASNRATFSRHEARTQAARSEESRMRQRDTFLVRERAFDMDDVAEPTILRLVVSSAVSSGCC